MGSAGFIASTVVMLTGLLDFIPGLGRFGGGEVLLESHPVVLLNPKSNDFGLGFTCTHILYTLAPVYLYRDYSKANVCTI